MQSMDVPRQPKRTRLRCARTTTVSIRQSTRGSDVVFGQYLEKEAVDAAHASTSYVGSTIIFVPAETHAYATLVEGTAHLKGRGTRS